LEHEPQLPHEPTQFVTTGQLSVLQFVLESVPLEYAQLEPPFTAAVVME
jgi:hypothetical protein